MKILRSPGHLESWAVRAGEGLGVQAPGDRWRIRLHGSVAVAVSLLPPGASAYQHSLPHSFIHSLSKYTFSAHEVAGTALGHEPGDPSPCPSCVWEGLPGRPLSATTPGSEQRQERDRAWVGVWECPWLDAGDMGQGHPPEGPDDGMGE